MRFSVEDRATGREGIWEMPRVGNKPPGRVSSSSKGRDARRGDTMHATMSSPGKITDIMLLGGNISGKESSQGQFGALACMFRSLNSAFYFLVEGEAI